MKRGLQPNVVGNHLLLDNLPNEHDNEPTYFFVTLAENQMMIGIGMLLMFVGVLIVLALAVSLACVRIRVSDSA